MKLALQQIIEGCCRLIDSHIITLAAPSRYGVDNEAIYKWSKIKAHLKEILSAIDSV